MSQTNINKISFGEDSIELHKKLGGKLEIKSKVSLNTKEDLSLSYSPGVGAVSIAISEDKNLAKTLTIKKNTVAIISDGSAILGLGNLGAKAAIPVMEGKAAILKEFAGVDAFPICIESQDSEEIIQTIKNISPVFGGINLEDISSPKCFEIEERLRKELDIPVMHDDQWGAATVALTAMINSFKLLNKDNSLKEKDISIVLSGVGAAGVATARLLIDYGFTNIFLMDSQGLIHKDRNDLNKEKQDLLNKSTADLENYSVNENLENVIKNKNVFIGLSKSGLLSKEMVSSMSENPIIFALANPNPEIMPDEAKEAGAFIVATGRSDFPNQINNSLVFPGFWKGMLAAQLNGTYQGVDNSVFIKIAEALAYHVKDLNIENILPNMFDKEVVDLLANMF